MFLTLIKLKENPMDNVKKNIKEYQDTFDKLVQERQQLVNRMNEINVAMEQLRGAVGALKGLDANTEEEQKKELPKQDKK